MNKKSLLIYKIRYKNYRRYLIMKHVIKKKKFHNLPKNYLNKLNVIQEMFKRKLKQEKIKNKKF